MMDSDGDMSLALSDMSAVAYITPEYLKNKAELIADSSELARARSFPERSRVPASFFTVSRFNPMKPQWCEFYMTLQLASTKI